ncbi:MAG: (2Fe-2S)-binding protein [Cellvibrionaceae bacterium]
MFVCLCKGITDTQIKQSIKDGADSLRDVRRDLGAATQCCKCLPEVRSIVNDALSSKEQSSPLFSPALFFPAETQT